MLLVQSKFPWRIRAHLDFLFVAAFTGVLAWSYLSVPRTNPQRFNSDREIIRYERGKVGCIKIVRNFGGREGIGSLVHRTQLAFFLASVFDVEINFPRLDSVHGYGLHDMFSECAEAEPSCYLNEQAAAIARCPPGDCECMKRSVAPHVLPLTKNCSVISVATGPDRNREYGGCLTRVMKRYLGTEHPPWEKLDYDVLHFRAGDLARAKHGKAYHPYETNALLQQMCLLSNRDIVVVTEGTPSMPVVKECKDRLVMAGNTTMKEALGILQHGKHVSLGISSFAILAAELVRPERMVIVERAAETFEWVDCEKWTVISDTFSAFHFHSRELMSKSVISRSLLSRGFTTHNQRGKMKNIRFEIPERRWSNDTSWITTRQR